MVLAPCEKTACIQVLYVDKFLWRFFHKGFQRLNLSRCKFKRESFFYFFNNQLRAVGFVSLCDFMYHCGILKSVLLSKPCGVFRSACCFKRIWVGRTTPLRGGVEAVRHGCRCILKKGAVQEVTLGQPFFLAFSKKDMIKFSHEQRKK